MSLIRAPRGREKLVGTVISSMKEEDLDQVLDIERDSFPTPWPASFFKAEMRNPLARSYVLRAHFEEASSCVGYICAWFIHDELHILNLAIHPDFRRLGFGLRLLRHVLHLATESNLAIASLEARPSNAVALNLYRKLGFRAVGVRPNYYYDTREDAVALELDLTRYSAG